MGMVAVLASGLKSFEYIFFLLILGGYRWNMIPFDPGASQVKSYEYVTLK